MRAAGQGRRRQVAKSLDDVHRYASAILDMTLVTHQTGPEGRVVNACCGGGRRYPQGTVRGACSSDRASQTRDLMASSEAAWRSRKSRPMRREDPQGSIDPVDV